MSYIISVVDELPDYAPDRDHPNIARHPWPEIAAAVREANGKWVCVEGDFDKSISHRIRRGKPKHFAPAGSFEASGRDGAEGSDRPTKLYIRYAGGA